MLHELYERWPNLKRDVQAASLLLGIVLALVVVRGGGRGSPAPDSGSRSQPEVVQDGDRKQKNARIEIDLASKKASPVAPNAPTPEAKDKANSPTPVANERLSNAEGLAKPEPKEPMKTPEPLPTPTTVNPVRATAIEKTIRPVEAMTAKEQQEVLDSYAAWEKDGAIRIRVALVDATPSAIEAIADSFYLKRGSHILQVKCGTWRVLHLETGTDVADSVLQALPTEKWPSRLLSVCREWLAELSGVRADVLLTPKARLEVYRRVGEMDLKEKLIEGTVVNLKLSVDPKNNQWSFTVTSVRKGQSLGMNNNDAR